MVMEEAWPHDEYNLQLRFGVTRWLRGVCWVTWL